MTRWNKRLWRMAVRIEQAYREARAAPIDVALPDAAWRRVCEQLKRLSVAETRGWRVAATHERRSAAAELERIGYLVRDAVASLRTERAQFAPTIRTLYDELLAVAEEFDDLNLEGDTLSVTTEPIELEGIRLGRFSIRLDLDELAGGVPFQVVALEPNPAASSPDVTHPHVNDGALCAGEGRRPIAAAIEEGRLFDFFTVVNRVLHTYAEGAAYVELHRWEGVPCHGCDCLLDDESTCCCSHCEETICGECLVCCACCSSGYCSNCIQFCQRCDEHCCAECLVRCPGCQRHLCHSCRDDELCTDCNEEIEDEMEEAAAETAAVETTGGEAEPAV